MQRPDRRRNFVVDDLAAALGVAFYDLTALQGPLPARQLLITRQLVEARLWRRRNRRFDAALVRRHVQRPNFARSAGATRCVRAGSRAITSRTNQQYGRTVLPAPSSSR